MAILKVFKNRIPNSNYITKAGKQLSFVNGTHTTDNEVDVQELEAEIKSGNPHIYVDENEKEVDSEAATPIQQLEQKMRAKILAEMAAATDKNNDRGNTEFTGKLEGISNSTTVAEGMAGSDSMNAGAIDPATAAAAAQAATGPAVGDARATMLAALAAKK